MGTGFLFFSKLHDDCLRKVLQRLILRPLLPFSADPDCENEAGNVVYIACPYESILMGHCFRCYHTAGEVVVCDGWSEEEVRAQCASPVPLPWAASMVDLGDP